MTYVLLWHKSFLHTFLVMTQVLSWHMSLNGTCHIISHVLSHHMSYHTKCPIMTNVLSSQMTFHYTYHLTCPITPHVLSSHMSFHTKCPFIPNVLSYQMSYHDTCPITPNVLSWHMPYHTKCPIMTYVLSSHMFFHYKCPITPNVLLLHTSHRDTFYYSVKLSLMGCLNKLRVQAHSNRNFSSEVSIRCKNIQTFVLKIWTQQGKATTSLKRQQENTINQTSTKIDSRPFRQELKMHSSDEWVRTPPSFVPALTSKLRGDVSRLLRRKRVRAQVKYFKIISHCDVFWILSFLNLYVLVLFEYSKQKSN